MAKQWTAKEWWLFVEPIHKTEGDGQSSVWTYARFFRGHWQYAIVEYSDDGDINSVTVLYNGKRTEVQ